MWRGKCAVRARYVLVPATALCISLLAEGSAGALKRCQNQDWPSDAFSELTIAHHPRQESERFWRSTQARCALSQVTRRMISDRSPLTRHRLSCALSIAEVRKAVPEQFRRSPIQQSKSLAWRQMETGPHVECLRGNLMVLPF